MRYLLVAVALTASCGSNGCGSSGSGSSGSGSSGSGASHEKSTATASQAKENASARAVRDEMNSSRGTEKPKVKFSTAAAPSYVDEPLLLFEVDKFGARVSGGSWFKALPPDVRRKHAKDFERTVVAAFRRLSPLKATSRTVGRSLFHPAITGLRTLLEKRAELVGSDAPVPVELRVKRGVPFWLVAHFANFLLWNDGVSHLQVRSGKKRPPLVIARSGPPAADERPPCAQGQVLLRTGGRALVHWEVAFNQGLSSSHAAIRPAWAGPSDACGPWHKLSADLLSKPVPEAAKLSRCPVWRVEAVDEADWDDLASALASALPQKNQASSVLLGNVNRPQECGR